MNQNESNHSNMVFDINPFYHPTPLVIKKLLQQWRHNLFHSKNLKSPCGIVASVTKTTQEQFSNIISDLSTHMYLYFLSVEEIVRVLMTSSLSTGLLTNKENFYDNLMYIAVIPFIKVRTKIFFSYIAHFS